jgi:uncharacterized 2Fe-2S/4Fe-4S cluster protein (DUF4445 family)
MAAACLAARTMPITLTLNSHTTAAPPGPSLFDYADQLGVRVPTSCHKAGKCRECLVEVLAGEDLLSPPTPEEQQLKDSFRLACRCHVRGDAGVVRCHTLRRGQMQIEEHASALPERLAGRQPDPAVTRDGQWVLLDGAPLVRAEGPVHGLAIDVGTTTVAVRLVNLATGELVARSAFENPQRFGGSNVMARVHFDTVNPGRLLQRTLLSYLAHVIEELPVDPLTIYEVVVAGNSTMRDLFFGLDVHSIGQKPFHSLTEVQWRAGQRPSTSLETKARQLRLPIHPQARIFGLPLLSAHVGADAAANLLAIDFAHEDRLVAVMDIGTNTELLLGNRQRLFAASCPAGPAFEGGGVSCGMPALPGAIERVALRADGRVDIQVIGGAPPEGLCGSGLVDLLGELRRTDRMNVRGRFAKGASAFAVAEAHQVRFTERDVAELAQAKGATVAGLQILFKQFGAHFADVEVFYLSGGFARHLDVEACKRVGLVPNLDSARFVKAGNLSAQGAMTALLSRSAREDLERLVCAATHVELETDPDFFDHFVEGCQFLPLDEVQIRG